MATEKHYLDKDGLGYLKTKMDETYAVKSELETAKQELQTSIESKAAEGHQHVATDITDAGETWAEKTHNHGITDLTGVAAKEHTHTAENITDGDEHWATKTHSHVATDISDGTTAFAAHEHEHTCADITDLEERLEGLGGTISNPINDAVVTLDQTDFTWDGKEHAPKVTKVMLADAELTVSDDYVPWVESHSGVGTYQAEVFGVLNYGGVVEPEWHITKAKGSIFCTPSEITISGVIGSTATATLTVVGDGAITLDGKGYVTGSVNSARNQITLTSVKVTDTPQTLTITMAEGTTHTGASCSITVTVRTASTTLNENSWDVIAQIAAAGEAKTMWKVGDKKDIVIGGTTYHAQIIGFDHDDLGTTDTKYGDASYNKGSKKAGITFQTEEITEKYSMNSSNTNQGGWNSSKMHSYMATVKNKLPADCQNVLRKVVKKTATGGNQSNVQLYGNTDQLFLLSEVEVFGTNTYSMAGEGTQYAYYSANNTKVKKYNGSADWWWLRSPDSSNSGYFRYVYSDGYSYGGASGSGGVAAGFCV